MEFGIVQFVYLVISAIVVRQVIVRGVGQKSNYVPPGKEKGQNKRRKGGESPVPTN